MRRRVTCVAVRRLYLAITLFCMALVQAGCNGRDDAPQERALAEAFVGPITLNMRKEISPASAPIATAKHGEKVDVLQVRRRFVRVRTPRGEQGWTDSRNLLSAQQMDAIAEIAKTAAKMRSQ